jgi:hypothetical protein
MTTSDIFSRIRSDAFTGESGISAIEFAILAPDEQVTGAVCGRSVLVQ